MAIRPSTEAKLLDAAEELFFSQGISATPIDAVLARARVSAATLYRGYPSKEALVAAVLERRHRAWIDTWDRAIDRADTARDKLLAVFDALDEFRSRPEGSRWCAFLGSAAEYAVPSDDIGHALARDTDVLRQRFLHLAEPVVGHRAAGLSDELLLVVTGDLAMRLRNARHDTVVSRSIAGALIDRTAPSPPGAPAPRARARVQPASSPEQVRRCTPAPGRSG